jgi:GntR family transcriptional regulator/MocR family aminotransferase
MEFHVSLVGRKSLSVEIYRQLRRAIIDGVLAPGDPLPPSRELARRLSVSRTTVTVAYDRLAGEGYVESRVGAGTYVSFRRERPAADANKRRPAGVLRPLPVWETVRVPVHPEHPPRFCFITGMPDASLFPHQVWRRLITRELRSPAVSGGAYGDAAGHPGLRQAISRHIAVSRGVESGADDVTITNGIQQALDVMARVLLAPGDRVAVEDPGYLPPSRLFATLGAEVIGVPVDEEGLVVEALPRDVRLVYVTPSHQYPLGVTMSMPRRQALLDWAERSNAAIIEDDYDSEFRFGGRPMEPLHTLDDSGRVIYVGSFSKTMLPSLRIGFVITPASLTAAVHKAKHITDWHTNMLGQAALARFIDEGDFARHVRKLGSIYKTRHELMLKIFDRDFAGCLKGIPSTVGLHVTARSSNASVEEVTAVVRRARDDAGVVVHRLSEFAVTGPQQAGVVLGYGAIATADIEEGLRRLRACFEPEA